jgi:hypothetical protein
MVIIRVVPYWGGKKLRYPLLLAHQSLISLGGGGGGTIGI